MNYQQYLPAAINAAKAAEKIIRAAYQQQLEVEIKSDDSPVTQADIACEQAIRGILSEAFPEHGFYGEELGRVRSDAEFIWYIDPIDGTKSFVREYPMFSTQIALRHTTTESDQFVLGVSNAPMFNCNGTKNGEGELMSAVLDKGAHLHQGDKTIPLSVSDIAETRFATLSFGNAKHILTAMPSELAEIVQSVHRLRGYGDFLHYHLLASGKLEMTLESELNILDIAALSVIITEAGGRVTDLEGNAIDDSTTTLLATNGKFHDALLAALAPLTQI